MTDKIWLIQYSYESDSWSPDWEFDTDHGFFLTEEDAAAYVDALNKAENVYTKYVEEKQETYATLVKNFSERARQWDILYAAGEDMKKPRPRDVPALRINSFGAWLENYSPSYRYEAVERGGQK